MNLVSGDGADSAWLLGQILCKPNTLGKYWSSPSDDQGNETELSSLCKLSRRIEANGDSI